MYIINFKNLHCYPGDVMFFGTYWLRWNSSLMRIVITIRSTRWWWGFIGQFEHHHYCRSDMMIVGIYRLIWNSSVMRGPWAIWASCAWQNDAASNSKHKIITISNSIIIVVIFSIIVINWRKTVVISSAWLHQLWWKFHLISTSINDSIYETLDNTFNFVYPSNFLDSCLMFI